MDTTRVLKIGDSVQFIDTHGVRHNALVTIWHGHADGETIADFQKRHHSTGMPCVNLLYVVSEEDKTDPHGRQIARASSVVHGDQQAPARTGYCFLFADEA